KRFFSPNAGETSAHLAGSISILVESRTERRASTRDPGEQPRTDGTGNLRSTRNPNGAIPVDCDFGRSSLGGRLDFGRHLCFSPPPRTREIALDRHIPAGGCCPFSKPAKGSETRFARPPSLPRDCR